MGWFTRNKPKEPNNLYLGIQQLTLGCNCIVGYRVIATTSPSLGKGAGGIIKSSNLYYWKDLGEAKEKLEKFKRQFIPEYSGVTFSYYDQIVVYNDPVVVNI